MSFWNTSDGETVEKTNEFDAGGGFREPIPEGTQCLAAIEEARWAKDGQHNEYIALKWTVLAPADYAGQTIPQKLWVTDYEPAAYAKGIDAADRKRDKAKRMLAAIDTNAGGKLMALDDAPTDEDLTKHLTNKQMVIRAMVWTSTDRSTGEEISGNWVGAVAPKVPAKDLPPPPAPKQRAAAKSGGGSGSQGGRSRRDDDDEIPF